MFNTNETRTRLATKLDELERLLHSGSYSEARAAALTGEVKRLQAQVQAQDNFAATQGSAPVIERNAPWTTAEQRTQVDAMQREAFELTLRGKQLPRQLRTYAPLDSTETTQGQYVVPVVTTNEIDHKIKSAGNILSAVKILPTTTGGVLQLPKSDGTSQAGEFINENAAFAQANPVYDHMEIDAFQWSSKEVIAPLRLIQDAQYPLLDNLTEEFAQRAERGWSTRLISDSTDGVINVSGTGSLAAVSATVLNYFEALNLQSKVDSAYAVRGSYAMSYTTMLGYASLVTTTGGSLWPEAERSAGRFHGRPFYIANDIPVAAHSQKYLLFGDLSKIILRKVRSMTVHVLRELYMQNLQNAFIAEQRVAGKVVESSALAWLVGA